MEENEELYFFREINLLKKRQQEMIDVVGKMKTSGQRDAKQDQEKIMEMIRVNEKAIQTLKNYSNDAH